LKSMRGVVLIAVLLLYVSAQPSLLWPDKWKTSRNRVVVGNPRTLVSFATYYVDATTASLRVSEESCVMDNIYVGVCDFYFVNNNCYLAISSNNTCCLLFPNLPPTPQDWLQRLNHTYLGVGSYLGEKVYGWMIEGMTYYQRVTDPVFPFAILGLNSPTDGLEFFASEIVDFFSANIFALPSRTCSNACSMAGKSMLKRSLF